MMLLYKSYLEEDFPLGGRFKVTESFQVPLGFWSHESAAPPQGRYRLSTLYIVLLHTLEFRLLNQIDLFLSGDRQ